MAKSWNEKLNDSKNMPVVEEVKPEVAARMGGTKMLLAPPLAYDELMKRVPKGKLITVDRMRSYLAKKYKADFACPLTGGIFVNIAANASAERKANAGSKGGADETPYWRTLKAGGELCEKFPGGLDQHKILLEMEGHKVIQKGKRCFVADYEKSLYEIK